MPISDELSAAIKPGDDFYRYVNQRWLDEHPIPDDKSRVTAFTFLADENIERLHVLLKREAPANEPKNIGLLRRFFRAGMDEDKIEQDGLSALQPYLDKVDALTDAASVKELIGGWHGRGMSLLWRANIEPDDKNSQRYILRFYQAGLGLPDRDYYVKDGPRFEGIRSQYHDFLVKFFELLGSDDADRRADDVIAIENELAQASATAVEKRDVDAMYNLYSRSQLEEEFTGLDWTAYLEALQLPDTQVSLVSQPTFLNVALGLLASEPIDRWQNYLRFHMVRPLMPNLTRAYDELSFSFYGRVLMGARDQEPRYRRIIGLAEHVLPQPTGQLFVEHHFDESAKKTIYALVSDIQEALRVRIDRLDWMSPATKARALEKLDTFLPLLGYPDTWRDYDKLKMGGGHAANFMEAIAYEWDYETGRMQEPVDHKEWLMSPATVNAYYWASTNGITFPAGILQPPYFDASGDVASNYGAIGVVIGHEITHGFDDNGSKFDKTGNLNSWWTDDDRSAFDTRAAGLKAQFDAYELDGTHVNGSLTLGENTADLAGILIAYDALQRHQRQSSDARSIDGLTPEQRFFIAYARVWRGNARPELTQSFLVTDPHSPRMFRVNGVVLNVDAFYDAFEVQPGNALYCPPAERVRIW
jgi:predicted metalloendopeptidase